MGGSSGAAAGFSSAGFLGSDRTTQAVCGIISAGSVWAAESIVVGLGISAIPGVGQLVMGGAAIAAIVGATGLCIDYEETFSSPNVTASSRNYTVPTGSTKVQFHQYSDGDPAVTTSAGARMSYDSDGNKVDMVGSAYNDTMTADKIHKNSMTGGAGNDKLTGSAHADSFSGGSGNDVIVAGNGSDNIYGGAGYDTMTGNGGDDTFHFSQNRTDANKVMDYDMADDHLDGFSKIVNFALDDDGYLNRVVDGAGNVVLIHTPYLHFDDNVTVAQVHNSISIWGFYD